MLGLASVLVMVFRSFSCCCNRGDAAMSAAFAAVRVKPSATAPASRSVVLVFIALFVSLFVTTPITTPLRKETLSHFQMLGNAASTRRWRSHARRANRLEARPASLQDQFPCFRVEGYALEPHKQA